MISCPAGHDSDSEDYCDTCGMPIEQNAPRSASPSGPAAPASARPATPTAVAVECPNCATENVADALFCEACGYDFTTGTMPRPIVNPFATLPGDPDDPGDRPAADPSPESFPDPAPHPAPAVAVTPVHPASASDAEAESDVPTPDPAREPPAGPSVVDDSATDGPDAGRGPDPGPTSQPSAPAAREEAPDETAAPAPTPQVEPSAPPPVAGRPAEPFVPGGFDTQTFESSPAEDVDSSTVPFAWVAEVWIDPDWYRQQEPPDPMPSPGLPEVVPLRRRSILIGRPSRSRNITPDIDCESDPGASRRQAQLTTDGRRWFVEDLDSSNGTYVAGAAEALPQQPLRANTRHELDPDDRIYLGAWTRLVIRRATPEEHEAYG